MMRDPEWFLAKIAAGLEAVGLPPEVPSPVRKLSRAEIDSIVTATLHEEVARLNGSGAVQDSSGPARRADS